MTKKRIIVGVIILAVLVGGYFYFSREKAPSYEFVAAQKGNLTQEVSVTGKVKPEQTLIWLLKKAGKYRAFT